LHLGMKRKSGKKNSNRADKRSKGEKVNDWSNFKVASWRFKEKENKLLESYYVNVGVVPEEERADWMDSLKKPLPITFRVLGCYEDKDFLVKRLQTDFNDFPVTVEQIERLEKVAHQSLLRNSDTPQEEEQAGEEKEEKGKKDGDEKDEDDEGEDDDETTVEPPHALPWYPEGLAWRYNFSKRALKKAKVLKDFHNFLKRETSMGNISRQEEVSMIPPVLFDLKESDRVLDMCASPGSKTAQLLEALHATTSEPTGVVVANDVDFNRSNLLIHQTNRIASPALIVTNHDASKFPLTHPTKGQFDAILCDVPCSGDGTMRKNPELWSKWNPGLGAGLHTLQLRILLRAAALCKVGGTIVFSTCSMNPIEDESVVAAALAAAPLSIVDCSDRLPGLKRREGLSSWKVYDWKDDVWYSKPSDVPDDPFKKRKFVDTMFPPAEGSPIASEMKKCMRILPQDQDTGGFFIVKLVKTAPFNDEDGEGARTVEDVKDEEEVPEEAMAWKGHRFRKQELFPLLDVPEVVEKIKKFYSLKDTFPMHRVARTSQKCHKLHYLSKGAFPTLAYDKNSYLNVVHGGVKVMDHNDSKELECGHRPVQEGVKYFAPHMQARTLKVDDAALESLLLHEKPLNIWELVGLDFRQEAAQLTPGCVVLECTGLNKGGYLCGWKGRSSLGLFIATSQRNSLYFRLKGEDRPRQSKEEKKQNAAE